MTRRRVTRRLTMAGMAAAAGAAAFPWLACARSTPLGYAFPEAVADRGLGLAPPRACTPGTPSLTEGPYYTPSTRAPGRPAGDG